MSKMTTFVALAHAVSSTTRQFRTNAACPGQSILEDLSTLPDRPLSFVERTYTRRYLQAGPAGNRHVGEVHEPAYCCSSASSSELLDANDLTLPRLVALAGQCCRNSATFALRTM